jgi:TP901 family phage tail tape measure protein
MTKITEEASATVTMNMEPARKSLEELQQNIKTCRDKLAEMMAEPEQKRDLKGIKELEAHIAQLEKREQAATEKLQTFRDTMKNLNGATFNQLYKASKELESQIKRLKPGTEEYIAATHDLRMVRTRINDLREGWKAVGEEQKRATLSLKGLADGFNRYFGMATTAIASITGLSMAFRKAAEEAAKLDDVYADVMKTTGLLHEEVQGLDEELMKIDTRTSREQLLLLARDAGKLGITGKENILGFVRAADQIQVALGEDLGEGAIRNLGKIADVLGYTQSMGVEKSLLSIASAVNAVGQASTASESYLVDFTQRMAGVGQLAHLSAADIIGFASGLDQSAMKVEMSATAFQKFMMKLYSEPEKFAQYAHKSVSEFADLMKNDANAAMIEVLKGLREIGDMSELTKHFDEMGLDGARTVQVLGAMASNLNAVTDAQRLANEEFEKATSVTEEYMTKNNNLQAQLEKARKEFHNASITLGQSLNPIMLKSTKATTYLIKALVNYGKEIRNAAIALAVLTAAVKMKNIVQGIANGLDKAHIVLIKTKVVVTNLLKVAYFKLTKQTEEAAVAQAALNGAMSASVFGLVAMAVATLVGVITRYVNKTREAAEEIDYLAEAEKRANEEYGEQAGKIRALTAIVENNNIALGERKKALDELKRIVPGYHADLTEEGRLINNNKEAIDEYCKSLRQQLKLEARKEQLMEIERQIAALEDQKADAEERMHDALVKSGGNTTEIVETHSFWRGQQFSYTDYGQAKKDAGGFQEQIDALEAQADKLGERTAKLTKEISEEQRDVVTEEQKKTNDILSQAQFDYLQDRSDKLTKKEKEMVAKGYAALSEEESKALAKRYAKLNAADNKASDKRYQQAVQDLERQQREELNILNDKYFNQEITAEEHEQQLRDITMKYLQEKLQLAKDNNKDTTQIEAAIIKERMANRKADYDEALKQLQACQKDEENALAMSLANQEITEKEYQAQMLEVKMRYLQEKLKLAHDAGQDETEILQAILDAQLEAQKAANEEMAKLKKEAQEVIAGLDSSAARQQELQEQLARLDVLHNAELLSEQQYEEAVKQLRKKYADADLKERLANVQKYVDQVNSIMSEASNFVTALKEAESAKLEAEYQAQLTAAGDNAEKREEIENEYEQKQLDLKKKYADTEMAINIAKTIASGAVAAIKAYAEGGPYLGIALAALIAATTAAEVATIIAQRNAIKNTSVSSSSSGNNSPTVVTPTGYSEGGFTDNAANDNKPVGIVHANEWVAPAPMVRRNPVLFANLEQYRKKGFPEHIRSIGFADGGFTGSGSVASDAVFQKMLSTIERLETNTAANTAALNRLMDEGVPAFEVYDQHQSFETQRKRFKNATKR